MLTMDDQPVGECELPDEDRALTWKPREAVCAQGLTPLHPLLTIRAPSCTPRA